MIDVSKQQQLKKEKVETICNIPDHSVAVEMLLEALVEEGIVKSLDEIKFLESEKDIFVVRPSELIKIKKMEKNEDKLKNMYNLGYNDLNSRKSELKSYLNK